jgi:hypothetical protein
MDTVGVGDFQLLDAVVMQQLLILVAGILHAGSE